MIKPIGLRPYSCKVLTEIIMDGQFTIFWNDAGLEPKHPPDPAYPNGRDIDGSNGAARTCTVELPYPARRCGVYAVRCVKCGFSFGATTAGRFDDPKSIKVACFSHKF